MFSKQLVLALLLLHLGLALSFQWDIVVAQKKQLEFYYNGNLKYTKNITSATGIITSVTYDPVYNRVLFTDYSKPNMVLVVSSIDLSTMEDIQTLFVRKTQSISRIAYEPVTQLLFWTENKKIYSRSLSREACNEAVNGNGIVSLDYNIGDIAVDSCGGYIYWITDYGIGRAWLNSYKTEVLIDLKVYDRRSVAFDQQRQKIYWVEKVNDSDHHLSIKSIDLKANNKTSTEVQTVEEETYANSLTVTKDFIYWIGGTQEAIWQLPKNQELNEKAKLLLKSHQTCSYCQLIAAKYTAQDEHQEINNCKTLENRIQRYNLCLRGIEVSGSRCVCEPGYTSEGSDVSLCYNYCLQGDCSISPEGQPKCSCKAGHSGERCEVKKCDILYCLNGGTCGINEINEPICDCTQDYEGDRCEVPAYLDKWLQTISMLKDILNADIPSVPRGNGVKSSSASTNL